MGSRRALRVYLASLGCSKNQVDSERILGGLAARAVEVVDTPEGADVVIVNTCAFIRPAEEEAVQALLEAAELKRRGKIRKLLAAGCLVSRHGKAKLAKLIPELDAAFLPQEADQLAAALVPSAQVHAPLDENRRWLLSGPGWAYLKIAEGCSRRCTYCLIPSLRGPLRSVPLEQAVHEAEALVGRGARELIVVAQDITQYGQDLKMHGALTRLLDRLVKIPRLHWLRLMYANPDGVGEGLIRRLAGERKLCKYLDMPIQHSEPRILRLMGRPGDGAGFLRLIQRLRRRVPGLVLRTTLLTGFPGETETEHRALLAFMKKARFDRLGVFTYSREAQTRAAVLKGQIPTAVKKRRGRELMEAQSVISRERLQLRVGQTAECLVEESSGPRHVIARTAGEAPEVDGNIVLQGRARPGDWVRARITGATEHDLRGEIL